MFKEQYWNSYFYNHKITYNFANQYYDKFEKFDIHEYRIIKNQMYFLFTYNPETYKQKQNEMINTSNLIIKYLTKFIKTY